RRVVGRRDEVLLLEPGLRRDVVFRARDGCTAPAARRRRDAGTAAPGDSGRITPARRGTSLARPVPNDQPSGVDAGAGGGRGAVGAEVGAFFRNNCHVVRMSPGRAAGVRAMSFGERVEPSHPWFRLEPALQDWLTGPAPPGSADERLRLRVAALEWGETG